MVDMSLLDKNISGIFLIAPDLNFHFESIYSYWDNNCNLENVNLLLWYFPDSDGNLEHQLYPYSIFFINPFLRYSF